MEEKAKGSEVDRAKDMLKKMAPELAVMAIRQAEVDFDEVDKIKDFLSRFNPEAVQYAIAEMEQEVMTKEIKATREKLKAFDLEVVKTAAAELGFGSKLGLCFESIKCRAHCIQVMVIRCGMDMFAAFKRDELVYPEMMEGVVGRAVTKAMARAKELGEL